MQYEYFLYFPLKSMKMFFWLPIFLYHILMNPWEYLIFFFFFIAATNISALLSVFTLSDIMMQNKDVESRCITYY